MDESRTVDFILLQQLRIPNRISPLSLGTIHPMQKYIHLRQRPSAACILLALLLDRRT